MELALTADRTAIEEAFKQHSQGMSFTDALNAGIMTIAQMGIVVGSNRTGVIRGGVPLAGRASLDSLSASGMRSAKGGLTHAGREYQKHMGRGELDKVPGTKLDAAGQDLLDDILTNPQTVVLPVRSGGFADGTRYIMPGSRPGEAGYGATFDSNGVFQYFGRY